MTTIGLGASLISGPNPVSYHIIRMNINIQGYLKVIEQIIQRVIKVIRVIRVIRVI